MQLNINVLHKLVNSQIQKSGRSPNDSFCLINSPKHLQKQGRNRLVSFFHYYLLFIQLDFQALTHFTIENKSFGTKVKEVLFIWLIPAVKKKLEIYLSSAAYFSRVARTN